MFNKNIQVGLFNVSTSTYVDLLRFERDVNGSSSWKQISPNGFLLELVVLGAAGLGQEPLSQLLQIARVVHLDLGLLAEEVLQVLEELHPELALLVQTFELFYQLSPDLCQSWKERFTVNSFVPFLQVGTCHASGCNALS